MTFPNELGMDVVETGSVVEVDYSVGMLHETADVALFDASNREKICLGPPELREVADHIERVTDDVKTETESEPEADSDGMEGWDLDDDVIMTNGPDTVGFVQADSHEKVMDDRAQSVLLRMDYLRDAVELADQIIDDDDPVWLSVQRGRPMIIQVDADGRRSAVTASPRINPNTDCPTEDL